MPETDHSSSWAAIDLQLVERLYARFASFYDWMFGPILHEGRREAVRSLDLKPGDKVLEIGIGTGLTAPLYPQSAQVTGIDVSEPMLRKAARHIDARALGNIRLRRMDARRLLFPDESFDIVYAAYVITVVPDPVDVLREMRRVCRTDGRVVLLNHFLSTNPLLSRLERALSPLTARVGFRADLDLGRLLSNAGLEAVEVRKVNVPKIWSLVGCQRTAA